MTARDKSLCVHCCFGDLWQGTEVEVITKVDIWSTPHMVTPDIVSTRRVSLARHRQQNMGQETQDDH